MILILWYPDIDKLIKDTIYEAKNQQYSKFLEWVPFERFTDIKQIGESGFSKVYYTTWMYVKLYFEQDVGSWKKLGLINLRKCQPNI